MLVFVSASVSPSCVRKFCRQCTLVVLTGGAHVVLNCNVLDSRGQVFEIKVKTGNLLVGGCRVASGSMQAGALIQVIRNGELVHEGKLTSLRNRKDVVKQVRAEVVLANMIWAI